MITRATFNRVSDFMSSINGEPWMARAACRPGRGHDPELWSAFPGDLASVRAAQRICAGCPVFTECQDYALNYPEPNNLWGIWGGLTEDDRRDIRRRRRRRAVRLAQQAAERGVT